MALRSTVADYYLGHSLSESMKDVALALSQGMSIMEIAEARGTSPATIQVQLRHVYARLGLRGDPHARVKLAEKVKAEPELFR